MKHLHSFILLETPPVGHSLVRTKPRICETKTRICDDDYESVFLKHLVWWGLNCLIVTILKCYEDRGVFWQILEKPECYG